MSVIRKPESRVTTYERQLNIVVRFYFHVPDSARITAGIERNYNVENPAIIKRSYNYVSQKYFVQYLYLQVVGQNFAKADGLIPACVTRNGVILEISNYFRVFHQHYHVRP